MKVTSQPTASSLKHAKQVYENGGTTALYAQVATNTIRTVMSPLDRLTPLVPKTTDEPPA